MFFFPPGYAFFHKKNLDVLSKTQNRRKNLRFRLRQKTPNMRLKNGIFPNPFAPGSDLTGKKR